MKPLTVANIALSYGAATGNLIAYGYRGNTISLILSIVFTLLLAFWIWRGTKENRLCKDMKALINDMAKQLIAHGGIYMEYKQNLVKPSTKESE